MLATGVRKWRVFDAIHPDGKCVASAQDVGGPTEIWDASSGVTRHTMEGRGERNIYGHISADGSALAVIGADRTMMLWDTASGRLLDKQHVADVHHFPFGLSTNTDGSKVAVGMADYNAYVWLPKTATRSEPGHTVALEGHTREVLSLSFRPDGQMLATGSADRTIRLWDLSGIEKHLEIPVATERVLEGDSNWIWSLAFSPDGTLLASGSEAGAVQIWDVATAASCASPAMSLRSCTRLSPASMPGTRQQDRLRR